MTPKIWVMSVIIVALFSSGAGAYTEKGFMTGGGVGSVSCPDFLNAMATARQSGGLTSVAGVRIINPFGSYVLGFQTGYNFGADGVYDVFSSFGAEGDHTNKILFAIEPWCAQHPEAKFDTALFELLKTLRENANSN